MENWIHWYLWCKVSFLIFLLCLLANSPVLLPVNFLIAQTTTIVSLLFLLSSRVSSHIFSSLSSWDGSFKPDTIFVAALCILTVFLMSYVLWGDHPTAAYSSLGQISVTINFFISATSRWWNSIVMLASNLYVSLKTLFMCLILNNSSKTSFILCFCNFLISYCIA